MIDNFRHIGTHLLRANNSSNQPLKYEFLKNIAIIPQENKKSEINKGLCLNFDLDNDCFDFRLSSNSLDISNREAYYAHSETGSGLKIFLNTSSIFTLIEATVPNTLKKCKKLQSDRKTKSWFQAHISPNYPLLFEAILNKFFIPDQSSKKEKYILNPNKMTAADQPLLQTVKSNAINNKNQLVYSDLYKYFLNKKFNSADTKSTQKFPGIAQILINGNSILAYNRGTLKESYINLLYHHFIENKFQQKGIDKKKCHSCGHITTVLKSGSPLPMNFYGTTNQLYFNKMNSNKSYQSFALCEDCTQSAYVGMKYASNFLSDYIFQNSLLLIPQIKGHSFDPKPYRGILKILKTKTGSYKDELHTFTQIIKKSNRKNIAMDMMFYHAEKASFNIFKYIDTVESNDLIPKIKKFATVAQLTGLDTFNQEANFNLNTMVYLLFTKTQSGKPHYDTKKIIEFVATFINSEKFNYNYLLTNFNKCLKSRLLNEQYQFNKLAAFKMNLFLTILSELNILKGVSTMKEDTIASDVLNKDYQDFFSTHASIYANNYHKQGLFLLGTVIARILYAQKEKKSNFLKKMNFAGMSTRRLQNFINRVKEYTEIYKKDIFIENGIWGNIMDRLQGIENSGLSRDEVVFYLLSGISFSEYLGIKKHNEKKLNELTKENEK